MLHALTTGDPQPLLAWMKVRPGNAETVLDTHDGIGIADVGADGTDRSQPGLLTPAEVDHLITAIHRNSGGTSRLATGTAASNVDLYQVNCTFYDALGADDSRYLLARALQFWAPGTPQVYYVGLLAGRNDMELLRRTGMGRDVNRHYYTAAAVNDELRRPVVRALLRLAAELDSLGAGLDDALDEVREIARGIHPAALAKGGLRAALRALARRSPIPVDLDMSVSERLPEHAEVSVYYVVAEALTNAARHAHASAVSVEVEAAGEALRVTVRDDGAGGAGFAGGTGLVGLKDRVEALGGRIFLDSPRGAGTSLRVEPPARRRRRPHLPLASGPRPRVVDYSGGPGHDRVQVVAGPAQFDADDDLGDAVDQGEQAEQQGEGDRADARAGEQHHTEGDGHQSTQDEHRACPGGLPALERREDLEEPADERPDAHDQHEHERGGPGPDQGDHPGRQVYQPEEQVTEDRPGGATAERLHRLQPGIDERVHREQDDQRQDRHPWPGQGDDPHDNGQNTKQNQ